MRVVFDFFGVTRGALGYPAHHAATYDAASYRDAVRQLYDDFEHICPLRGWTASVDGVTVAGGTGWDS